MTWKWPAVRVTAKAILGFVLLAQVVLAAGACTMPVLRPAAAVAGEEGTGLCARQPAPNPALCLAQVLQADQIDAAHHPIAAPPAPSWFDRARPAPLVTLGPSRHAAALIGGPSTYLRLHRLLL